MIWSVYVVATPFLIWVWLGVSFTIIDLTIHLVRQWVEKELRMSDMVKGRARLIRYSDLAGIGEGVLSYFDAERNILHIDRKLAATLPDFDRERLETTEIRLTQLAGNDYSGLRWKEMKTLDSYHHGKLAAE